MGIYKNKRRIIMTKKQLADAVKKALTPPEGVEDPSQIQKLIAEALANAIVEYVKAPEG